MMNHQLSTIYHPTIRWGRGHRWSRPFWRLWGCGDGWRWSRRVVGIVVLWSYLVLLFVFCCRCLSLSLLVVAVPRSLNVNGGLPLRWPHGWSLAAWYSSVINKWVFGPFIQHWKDMHDKPMPFYFLRGLTDNRMIGVCSFANPWFLDVAMGAVRKIPANLHQGCFLGGMQRKRPARSFYWRFMVVDNSKE